MTSDPLPRRQVRFTRLGQNHISRKVLWDADASRNPTETGVYTIGVGGNDQKRQQNFLITPSTQLAQRSGITVSSLELLTWER